MTDNDIISFNIKRIRMNKNMTQDEVMKRMEVSKRTYIRIEKNPTDRKIDELIKLANILEVNLQDFFININASHTGKE